MLSPVSTSYFLGSFVCNVLGDKAYLYLKDSFLVADIYRQKGEVIHLTSSRIQGGKKGGMPHEELVKLVQTVAAPFLFASLRKDNTLRIFALEVQGNQFLKSQVSPPPNFYSCIERLGILDQLLLLLQGKQIAILFKDHTLPFKRVGKTELATQYFKSYAENYKCTFWIQAMDSWHLERDLKKMANSLQISVEKIPEWLENNDTYLIVFDGVEDPTLVEKYIPNDLKGHIIISTRTLFRPQNCLEIGLFTKEEGVSFLLTHTKGTQEAAELVTQALGYVPSSLYRALETIKMKGLKLSDYMTYCESVLEKNAQIAKSFSNLAPRNKDFIGREANLVALEESFSANKPVVLAANSGLGGVGKTQIALQYAYRTCSNYNLVWWIHCTNMESSYQDLAQRLQIYLTEEEKKEGNAIIKKVNRTLERTPGWLLIFDDASSEKGLEGLLPTSGGHILITSRSSVWDHTQTELYKIVVFKREESIQLLLKVTGLYGEEQDADQLSEKLQDLPLALAQAAAYIRETQISIGEYIRDFETMHKALWKREKPTNNYEFTLHVTWNLSMEKIQMEENESGITPYPMAMPLMQFCSFLAPDYIPKEPLLLHWVEAEHEKHCLEKSSCLADLNQTLSLLERYSMIAFAEQTRTVHLGPYAIIELKEMHLSLHSLVQTVTLDQMKSEDKEKLLQTGLETLAGLANLYDPEKNQETSTRTKLLMPHYERFVQCVDQFNFDKKNQEFTTLIQFLLVSYSYFGRLNKRKEYAEKNLTLYKEIYPQMHPFVATCLDDLGGACFALGQYEEALKLQEEALTLRKELQGEDGPDVAASLNHIGSVFRAKGDYETALHYQMKSLKLREKLFGRQHHETATSLSNIGLTYNLQGKHKEALTYLMDALSIDRKCTQTEEVHKKLAGTDTFDIATILSNIGSTCQELGKYKEALEYGMEALELNKILFGTEHPNIARDSNNVGQALRALGRYDEALEFLMRALEMTRKLLGENHFDLATLLNNIGLVHQSLGNKNNALEYTMEALILGKKLLGPRHPFIAKILNNIGMACADLGRDTEAYKYGKEALNLKIEVLGEEHPEVATSLNNLGMACKNLGNHDECLQYQMQALNLYKKLLGEEHPNVAVALNNVGGALADLGRNEEALLYSLDSLNMKEKLYGKEHPSVALSHHCVAMTYFVLENVSSALFHAKKASQIMEDLYPNRNHPHKPLFQKTLKGIRTKAYENAETLVTAGNLYINSSIAAPIYTKALILLMEIYDENLEELSDFFLSLEIVQHILARLATLKK